jgi:hypothetical protein
MIALAWARVNVAEAEEFVIGGYNLRSGHGSAFQ